MYSGYYDGANSTEENNEAGNWLDTSVPKSFDGDEDDSYGTCGFLQVTIAGSWDIAGAPNKDNWAYSTTSGQVDVEGLYAVNRAGQPTSGRIARATICTGTGDTEYQTGLKATKDYSHVRIGIMNDTLGTAAQYDDNTWLECRVMDQNQLLSSERITLSQTTYDSKADMYFFDVIGLKGTQIVRIYADHYASIITADEVVARDGDPALPCSFTFTDTTSPNYINPAAPSGLVWRREDGSLSSRIIRTMAEGGSDSVNAMVVSGLLSKKAYQITATTDAGTDTVFAASNVNGEVNVRDLTGLENVTNVTVSPMAATTGNGNIFIDLQGINPTAGNQRATPMTATTGGTWNAFEFQAHQGTPSVDPAMALVDSAGTQTSVVLSMTGNVTGWAGDTGDGEDPLTRDYMFAYAGQMTGKGDIEWELTGLMPNEWYELEMFTGLSTGRRAYFTVDDAYGYDERLVAGNSSDIWFVQADALGEITGIFASRGGIREQNWSGMTIKNSTEPLPEPGTWVLMITGLGGVLLLRRVFNRA